MSTTRTKSPQTIPPEKRRKKVWPAAAVLATGALACGVCCALPFALPAAALAFSAWLGGAYSWTALVAAIAVAAAWVWIALQSWRSRRSPARATVIAMAIATLTLAMAVTWPHVEKGLFVLS